LFAYLYEYNTFLKIIFIFSTDNLHVKYNLLQIETLSAELISAKKKCEELEVKYLQIQDELAIQKNLKNNIEQTLTDEVHNLEEQVEQVSP